MSSGTNLPVVDQAGAAVATTEALPATLLGVGIDLKSDKLYDLGGAIPDVMGLWAILEGGCREGDVSFRQLLC